MRLLLPVLFMSLTFTQVAQATVIRLKSIFNSSVTGEITVTEDKSTKVDYVLNVKEKKQAYAVLVYRNGNCKNFSTPVAVMVNDPKVKNKKNAFNPKGNQFLIFQEPSTQTKLTGSFAAPEKSFFSFEPRGKILVLVAIKNEMSTTGLALACGVFP